MAFCRDFFSFLSFFSGSRKKGHPGLLADVHNSKHTVLEQLSRVDKAGGGSRRESEEGFHLPEAKKGNPREKCLCTPYMYMYLVS